MNRKKRQLIGALGALAGLGLAYYMTNNSGTGNSLYDGVTRALIVLPNATVGNQSSLFSPLVYAEGGLIGYLLAGHFG